MKRSPVSAAKQRESQDTLSFAAELAAARSAVVAEVVPTRTELRRRAESWSTSEQ